MYAVPGALWRWTLLEVGAEDQRPPAGDERLALRGNTVPDEALRTEEEREVVVRAIIADHVLVAEHRGVDPEVRVARVVCRDPKVLPANVEPAGARTPEVHPVATTEVVADGGVDLGLRHRVRRTNAREERPVDPEGLRDVPLDRDLGRAEEELLPAAADSGDTDPDASLDRSELQTSGNGRRTTLERGHPLLDLVKTSARTVDDVEASVVADHRVLEGRDVLVHAALNAAVEVPEDGHGPIRELRVVHGRRAVDAQMGHARPHQLVLHGVAPPVGEVGVLQLVLRTELLDVGRAYHSYREALPLLGRLRDLSDDPLGLRREGRRGLARGERLHDARELVAVGHLLLRRGAEGDEHEETGHEPRKCGLRKCGLHEILLTRTARQSRLL